MGLLCSHGAFDAPYTAFDRFRESLAITAGGGLDHETGCFSWKYDPNVTDGRGLYEFFEHPDCGGEISPEMCVAVADDLDRLLPEVAAEHVGRLKKFIAGCRKAASRNEPLTFG